MNRPFLKMHGLGNDFVIIDSRSDGYVPNAEACRKIADRRRGVGCDSIIVMAQPADANADVFMHIFNSDGSTAGACGNAARCVAKLLFAETGRARCVVQTVSGLLEAWAVNDDLIAVDFGAPRLQWQEIPLAESVDTLSVPINAGGLSDPCCVNMGNPHAVFFTPDVTAVPLNVVGPKLETHPIFPDRCNIEIAQIINRSRIRMRVWERGAGITEACGSGACAVLVAAVRRGLSERAAEIVLDGGTLSIEWRDDGHVVMTGPAELSFRGAWPGEES